ncbi:MFS transporter [Vibrio lentus]|uniref:Multidrug transporter subunit MdtL n=1 Tax=Vibrio lentus TaxID=136468 RepID=A0AB36XK99_9VIBR|nr:MFS transporter [Vibrio lentus]MCC4836881.1 MFS transporter [Vibrio lentus]PMI14299.1 multidrug transporter subunit MdtL [Vibrio lentus]PMK29857.1 multidrug transporter subunit MdtL [Vibrio lentus]PMK45886.1 multidrug transporter subunit MdtL [Vibrio lentus]PML29202.1 multidrug transporter subunit MdtL [Vibrio lentus]
MYRFLFCSFALVLLYPTAIDLYLVGLPQIAADLNASEAQLHVAFSIYLAGMATTMLFAGKFADSVGRKPVAIFGAIVFAISSMLGGIVTSAEPFLAVRFFQGVGAGSCYVVAFAILRDVLDDQKRAKVLSMMNGITCIVPVLAPVIGHLIMTVYPWPSLFTTMASMGVVVCVLSVLVLKETKPNLTESVLAKASLSETFQSTSTETFKDPLFISRVIMTSLGVTAILTYVNVSPMLIMTELGFDRGQYSYTMALTALVSMLVSFSAPFALNVFKQKNLMLTSQACFVMAAILLLASIDGGLGHYVTLLGFAFVCGGFSLGFGVAMSQALSCYSQRAGVASSILGVSQVCTSALFIWLMGVIGLSALNMLVFILAAGGVISIALILWVGPSQVKSDYEEATSPS